MIEFRYMFKIVSEEKYFLIVDKASGISSHPSPGDKGPDVITELARGNSMAPLTRLDRPASGLVLISSNADFKNNFELLQKKYLALVFGNPEDEGTVDKPLITKQFTGKKVEQSAETKFKKTEQFAGSALLSVEINTGRHHQIRKHLRSIGCPIVGDFQHGYKDKNLALQESSGERLRMGLHCSEITFKYRGKEYSFTSETPDDMNKLIQFCRTAL